MWSTRLPTGTTGGADRGLGAQNSGASALQVVPHIMERTCSWEGRGRPALSFSFVGCPQSAADAPCLMTTVVRNVMQPWWPVAYKHPASPLDSPQILLCLHPETCVLPLPVPPLPPSFGSGICFDGILLHNQISKALLSDDARLRLPRFLEDEAPKDPEATKQDLIDKIAQLNASIDEVAAQLKSKDVPEAEEVQTAASLS